MRGNNRHRAEGHKLYLRNGTDPDLGPCTGGLAALTTR